MRTTLAAVLLTLVAIAGCDGGYDPPEQAEPFDTIAPAPSDTAIIGATGIGAHSSST